MTIEINSDILYDDFIECFNRLEREIVSLDNWKIIINSYEISSNVINYWS